MVFVLWLVALNFAPYVFVPAAKLRAKGATILHQQGRGIALSLGVSTCPVGPWDDVSAGRRPVVANSTFLKEPAWCVVVSLFFSLLNWLGCHQDCWTHIPGIDQACRIVSEGNRGIADGFCCNACSLDRDAPLVQLVTAAPVPLEPEGSLLHSPEFVCRV